MSKMSLKFRQVAQLTYACLFALIVSRGSMASTGRCKDDAQESLHNG